MFCIMRSQYSRTRGLGAPMLMLTHVGKDRKFGIARFAAGLSKRVPTI